MENKNTKCTCKPEDCNKGVHCDVKNCAYHQGQYQCTASCISVGPQNATSSTATSCVTFKPKEY